MQAKIIKTEQKDNDGYISHLIDFGDNMKLWFDVNTDGDYLTGDWNKYIFHTNNEQDMREQAFQEDSNDEIGAYNYSIALELSEEYNDMQIANDKREKDENKNRVLNN
jgi:hypothetical protein